MLGSLYRKFMRLAPTSHSAKRIRTDDVFPVHFIDRSDLARPILMSMTFRYNDVLDPKKLHGSLVKLLGMGDWRKLGGRLRFNDTGRMELHVPQEYSVDRPAIRYSHIKFDSRIEEHPLGRRLPKKTGESPSIQEGFDFFRPFSVPDNFPDNINQYFITDEPLISLHISSFGNATLVSISFPHLAVDGAALVGLLKAWSGVLADRLDCIPTVLGARKDVLEAVGTSRDTRAQTPLAMQHMQIKGFEGLVFAVRFGWGLLTRRKDVQTRTIFLPAKFVSKLCQTADWKTIPKKDTFFLSDGDLITAWCSRMVMASFPEKPAIICNIFDFRKRLSKTFDDKGVYLQNLILPGFTYLPAQNTSPTSVSQIAVKLRSTIVEQTTDTQIRSLLRVVRVALASTGLPPIFGSSDLTAITFSNWLKLGLPEAANFSGAVVSDWLSSSGKKSSQSGTCVSLWGGIIAKDFKARDIIFISRKDDDGNYWLTASLLPETWNMMQREFDKHV